MGSSPASATAPKHAGGWMTVIALGLLAVALLVCLYVLIGFPAEAQVNGTTAASIQLTPEPCPFASAWTRKFIRELASGPAGSAAVDQGVDGTAATNRTANSLSHACRRQKHFDNPSYQ
jgi:hypothetical protein